MKKHTPTTCPNTGLIYFYDIPFTSADIINLVNSMNIIKKSIINNNNQFDIEAIIMIKDKMNLAKHYFTASDVNILNEYLTNKAC